MDPQLHPLGTKVSSEGVRKLVGTWLCVKLAGVTDSYLEGSYSVKRMVTVSAYQCCRRNIRAREQ